MKYTNRLKCIWSSKHQGITPIVEWRIAKKVNRKVSSNYCKSCLMEKFLNIKSLNGKKLLSKRFELVSKCRHQNKLLLCNVKRNDSTN